jgi:DNA-binding LacI/PurR family transcriptional regulator/DNA-binding transcriptional regulator YhcF (GntR family)
MPQETANFTPRFQTLASDIIDKIQSGEFPAGRMLPSERELALQYDLSRQTIRNAMDILDQEGWTVSHPGKGRFPASRAIPPSRPGPTQPATHQIGLICHPSLLYDDIQPGHPILGLKSALSSQGYTLSLSVATKDVKHRMYPVFPRWLKDNMMDGYILASAPPRVQERLARSAKPVVSLGYLWSDADIPSVEMDYREIHRLAIHHLVKKKWLPACNLVPREKTLEDKKYTGESIGGHLQGAKELGLDPAQAEVMRHHDSAFELVAALRRLFRRDTVPRSLVFSNGKFLTEALSYLEMKGIQPNRDIRLLVIDPSGIPQSALSQIARFEADVLSVARRAGEKLLALLKNRDKGQRHERLVAGQFVFPNQSNPGQ